MMMMVVVVMMMTVNNNITTSEMFVDSDRPNNGLVDSRFCWLEDISKKTRHNCLQKNLTKKEI